MTLNWSCFISYRLGKGPLAAGIVKDFYEKLSNELELQLDEPVYLSQGELNTGDVVDPVLENALCSSGCMVLLFTGKYFSRTHTYCTREYLAMKKLEKSRQLKMPALKKTGHGLILPVVLRDMERLPEELRKRIWCDFQEFQQDEGGITRPKAYFELIRKLAGYIAARCGELSRLPASMGNCSEFHFPNEVQVRQFLQELSSPEPSVVRKRKTARSA